MFIRKTVKKHGDKTYVNYLLVQSVSTPKGPRQKTIVSLGNLDPGPKEKWVQLARQVQASLEGQIPFDAPEPIVDKIAEKVRSAARSSPAPISRDGTTAVRIDEVSHEDGREAGPVHVGHQMWQRLGFDEVLTQAGLSERGRLLTEVMTLNRLICPASEHAMPDWVRRTAMADILGVDLTTLSDEALYRNLDRLHPNREAIERGLAEREKTLFRLDDTVLLYDLTSTYFEGQCAGNPKAKRGYSRDHRPDCKQVVVGLVLDRDGFPKAHEIFDGNRQDRTTVDAMLQQLERRTGRKGGVTVIVDRGMAYDENLKTIRAHGDHYLIATRTAERNDWLDEFEDEQGWEEVIRKPSPRNPAQTKSAVSIKRREREGEVYVLCRSEGRTEKDRAIREKHEQRLLADLNKLKGRVGSGKLKDQDKIHEAIGRLKERYPRVARYYRVTYDPVAGELRWEEDAAKKARAKTVDGAYMLRTDRTDLGAEEIWRLYILLTRVESAFRDMKSPLSERPIFHQLARRVETHIFLCLLAYHLLIAIEKIHLDADIHTSWATLRDRLSNHQVVTVILPTKSGHILKIRKGGTPEPEHRQIYDTLRISHEVMKPVKLCLTAQDSDGTPAQVPAKSGDH